MLDFSGAVSKSRWSIKGHCQYCTHCMPCSVDIDIAKVNRIIDNKDSGGYKTLKVKASACNKCGICEERCPFNVKVTERIELAVQTFEMFTF